MSHRRVRRQGKKSRGIPRWFLITLIILAWQLALLYPAYHHFTTFK